MAKVLSRMSACHRGQSRIYLAASKTHISTVRKRDVARRMAADSQDDTSLVIEALPGIVTPANVTALVDLADGIVAITTSIPAAAVDGNKRPEPQFVVEFDPVSYLGMWFGIYGLHAVCVAYFIAAGIIYYVIPGTFMGGNLALYSLIIPLKYFKTISIVHYIVAAAHVQFLIVPFVRYLYKKLPVRGKSQQQQSTKHQVAHEVKEHRLQRSPSVRVVTQKTQKLWAVATYVYGMFFARNGFFGVEGNHFEFVFLMREVVETALQSYQAYKMSLLLPRHSLNRFYAIILVINCWSTPFFSHFIKHKPLQRLMCMLCDILLDFISSVWVPVYLAISYIKLYDPVSKDFPFGFWITDKSLVNIMNESPIILFGSAIDAFSRLLFSVSLLSSMEDVKELVQKRKQKSTDQHSKVIEMTTATEATRPEKTNSTTGSLSRGFSLVPTIAKALITAGSLRRETIIKWSHRIMITYGVIILAVLIQAETKTNTRGCVMELRPWLISQRACALVEMNCHTDSTLTGNLTNFEETFNDLDANSLEHVVYRHCPQVELGPKFQSFKNLIGMKIYNSTVTKWDDDAALTNTHHPRMVFAFYVYTKFPSGAVPGGLLNGDFPHALLDIEFVGTNIDHLPSDLDQHWPVGLNLIMDLGPFTTFPAEIPMIHPAAVSFSGNKMTDLTQELIDMVGTMALVFSGNPITHISDSLNGSACSIMVMFFDATNLSSIPLWMDEAFLTKTYVVAGRTPICDNVLLQPEAPATQQLLAQRPYLSHVDCTDYFGFDRTTYYALGNEVRAEEVWP